MHRTWFQSKKHPDASSLNTHVFGFPYAGGSATSLRPLEETVNPEISLHLATLPGRGRRFGEPATSDISVLVNGFCDAIERITPQRFVLFGHSMGGILAFEVARALRRRRNRFKPVALVASGVSAPHLFARDGEGSIATTYPGTSSSSICGNSRDTAGAARARGGAECDVAHAEA